MARQTLIHGQTGAELEFYPPEWPLGVPAAPATYDVFPLSGDLDETPELAGTATADPVATTFDAPSGPGQGTTRDRCHLTSTAGIKVGRRYVARNADGRSELIEVAEVDNAGAYVTHQGPLDYDYAVGDTFKGHRQSFVIDPDWIADADNIGVSWRVRWTYTIDAVQYQRWTLFDVARVSHHHNVTAIDLYSTRPDLQHEQLGDAPKDWASFIMRAEKLVAMDLRKWGIGWDQIRSDESDELVLARTHWTIADEGVIPAGREPESYVQAKKDSYYAALANLRSRMDLDKGTEGGATQKGHRQMAFGR